ncbi:response regulator transcription factor [Maioricimonas sp. JC845]|uniref:response regulator transcription factor n=1 Tax=Maioricimonas sp. JC845 TaxID=3232138 RepID=UPI003457A761
MSQVAIVDEHPIVRRGLAHLLMSEPDMESVGQAGGFTEAIRMFRESDADLTILEIALKEGSGLELIKQLVSLKPEAKLLVFSACDERLYAERTLRAGAHGFISKTARPEQLLAAMRRVLDGHVYLSEPMTNRLLSRAVGVDDVLESSPIEAFSDRELEVFEMIGQGIPTREIAERLHLSPKTVETYRENIKSKLGLRNAAELTQHAVQWILESRAAG